MSPPGPSEDTTLAGGARHFPSTCWSRFAAPGDPLRRRDAAELLARDYWKPVYIFIRAHYSRSNEDAKDLTQDFFLWMLESDFVSQADPARGRFRSFLKVAVKYYLSKDERKHQALRRGGERRLLSLEGMPADIDLPDPAGRTQEELFDLAWRNELLARAARQLEETLRKLGKQTQFQVFRDYHMGSGALGYREVAQRHGITETDVSNHLIEAKGRFRAILGDLVAETVGSTGDLDEEMKALFG